MYGHLKYHTIHKLSSIFFTINNENDLARILGLPAYHLNLLTVHPKYNVFKIPKNSGSRLIEAPDEPLMKILKKLKNYLQSVYYILKSDSAYGFILQPPKEKYKRNILTNARHHLGCRYMMNIDLKDFFHQITYSSVAEIFNSLPFKFDAKLVRLLCRLTTYSGRLPIGSPTSPPLSNLAMIPVDNELMNYAKTENLRFTRFVDDLTFSSQNQITNIHFYKIEDILSSYHFKINYDKIKTFSKNDIKIVTGLELKDNDVAIPDSFFQNLENDILRYKYAKELNLKFNYQSSNKMFEQAGKIITGKINFIGEIYGRNSYEFINYTNKFSDAMNITADNESARWLDLPYEFL